MTSKTTTQDALLDELLKGCENPQDILGEHGLLKHLTKRMIERALQAEMSEHLLIGIIVISGVSRTAPPEAAPDLSAAGLLDPGWLFPSGG
ncbi:MAG TPA: hypothetical protein ENI68_12930 [Gammaproteobacteria bacterium]|nr:hypothetical protein [Gammaproteobacteria bacterium]